MRRLLVLVAVVTVGFTVGVGVVLALQRPVDGPEPAATPAGASGPSAEAPSPLPDDPATTPLAKAAPAPEPSERLLLAWTSGGLPDGFADAVAGLPAVERTTLVHGGLLELTGSWDDEGQPVDVLDDGWLVPLDAVAVDPGTYPAFVSKAVVPVIERLEGDQALLSETSADLRGLDEGARLTLREGPDLTVVGIVDDAAIAGAELAVSVATGRATPAATPRYLLLAYRGDRAEIEQAVRGLLPDGPPLRLRGPGESPVLRHGDAVLTQAQVKERFGEFAYRRSAGRGIEQDPEWVDAHIETAHLPILGAVRCHRAILPALQGALAELEREHLAHTLDAGGYAGCYEPRLTSSLESVSRHAWGIAFDVNVDANPMGQDSAQDSRMVEVFEQWGFAWGGQWLVPDPAHFEYLRPPAPGADGG